MRITDYIKYPEDDWNDNVLHMSDLRHGIGEGCEVQLSLRLQGSEREEHTPGQKLMFWNANGLHRDIPNLLDLGDDGYIETIEHPLEYRGIVGSSDCTIIHLEWRYSTRYVIDWKSMRGGAFRYLDGPKESHKIQLQGYLTAWARSAAPVCLNKGKLIYADREGQNGIREYDVEYDQGKVDQAIDRIKAVADQPEIARKPDPKVRTRENKSNTAIYIESPWQCEYCDYRSCSCDGVVPEEFRDNGVCGHWDEEGGYDWDDNVPEELAERAETILQLEENNDE